MELKYKNCKYNTLRQVLVQEFGLSSRLITKLKKNNSILLNNKSTYLDQNLKINDLITVNIDFDEDNSNIVPTKMDLKILFEDSYMLIIDKPAGIPVHPSMEHYKDSLSNGVKYYFDIIDLHRKIRIVNRLDRNTSGIVIFAKNEYIQECLIKQMQKEVFQKKYIAFCEGIFDNTSGIINASIARKEKSIIERCVNSNGQEAITKFKVLGTKDNISKIEIELLTGRTHQIRVHMAYIGHPIIGDTLYGNSSNLINRQALHAYKVRFKHPITNKEIIITSPLPTDFNIFDKVNN